MARNRIVSGTGGTKRTAGLEVVDTLLQHRAAPDAAYYLGKGKLEELRQLRLARKPIVLFLHHSLSPSQLYNLGKALEVKVLDKTMLILDIFAQRARSKEGKLQVELAQANYLLPRLLGQGINLSRQGGGAKKGGVGTRGPGESKLETDSAPSCRAAHPVCTAGAERGAKTPGC